MKPKILLQLDSDSHPSSFDAVVAIDSGVDFLLPYPKVTPDNVVGLVHGAMFTRGPDDLVNTAIFVGGSDVVLGETIVNKVVKTMFDPLRVSVILDCNGCNSTASAAVLSAMKHVDLSKSNAVVMGATGAVGQRVAKLLLAQGAEVSVGSRDRGRSERVADALRSTFPDATIHAFDYDAKSVAERLSHGNAVFGCGAAGVELISAEVLDHAKTIQVAIDLNAVPPLGLGGIRVTDKAVVRGGRVDYGALGVGGLKMKIHKAAIRRAFEDRGIVIDAQEMLSIGQSL